MMLPGRAHSLSDAALALALRAAQPPRLTGPLPSFAIPSLLSDDAQLLSLLCALNARGAVLVTGLPPHLDSVTALASRIGLVMPTMYGHAWDVRAEPSPINVAYTSAALELHQDLIYLAAPPGLQLLHCIEPAVLGGESLLADALSIAESFRADEPGAFELLTHARATFLKVHYHREAPVSLVARKPHFVVDASWQVAATRDAQRRGAAPPLPPIVAVHWAPPFEGRPRCPSAELAPYLAARASFAAYLEGADVMEMRLGAGDALVFNNLRMLHGRRAFEERGGSPRRWLRGCYIAIDDVKSRLRTLNQAQGKVATQARWGDGQLE